VSIVQLLQDNTALFYGIAALFGLLVGSFLNVVIYRLPVMMEREWRRSCLELDCDDISQLPEQETFNLAAPASRCPKCDSSIKAWQNIPVISYILLRGKCIQCKTPISARYPTIEFLTAVFSAVVAWKFGPSIECLAGLAITWCLIALSMIDYDHQLLPDSITLPLMWLGLIASLLPVFVYPQEAILGAAIGYLSLWSIYHLFKLFTGKEGMGYGDFKLLAALGAWFGWQSLPAIILLSSVSGAVIGIALITLTSRSRDVPMPFGPFIAVAGWLYLVFGEQLLGLVGMPYQLIQ